MARDLTYEPEGTVKSTALERSNRGELIKFPEGSNEPVALRDSTFAKMGTKKVTKAQAKILMKAASPKTEIEILPSGEIYPPQIAMRKRLTAAFGPMGWALRPIMQPTPPDDKSVMYREYVLIADGRVVASAIGSQKYYANSKRMDYGDVLEAIKSDALKRCCKDLGVLWECWDPNFIKDWKRLHAVHVFVNERKKDRNGAEQPGFDQKTYWRRIDRMPTAWKFGAEIEPVSDSPNIDAWIKQRNEWTALIDRDTERIKAANAAYRAARARNVEARNEARELGIVNPDSTLPVIDVKAEQPEPPKETFQRAPKVEGTERGSRPPVTHAPRTINTDDKPFMIRGCKIAQQTPHHTFHVITMMDGTEYVTFDKRAYADMQKHFAARDKIVIQANVKRVDGKIYKEIVEWQIKSRGRMEQ